LPYAISDFQAAIRQREKDQRRARTCGMHFIDYFPHQELGIVYFETVVACRKPLATQQKLLVIR